MKSRKIHLIGSLAALVGLPFIMISSASVVDATANAAASTSPGATASADTVASIISRGDSEITRRLNSLNTLTPKISSSTKLNSTDKTSLSSEVTTEISGLTSLKTTLDACTTILCAHTNAQDIFTEYRVYKLVVPKVNIMSAADHQQQVEAGLSQIATQFATKINANSNSSLQPDLTTLNSDISSAESLSSSVETNVVGLQPSDYDSDPTILSQYINNLKTAATDNSNAIKEVKVILKAL